MSRKKKTPKSVDGTVWAKETEALAKSIAKDLNLPDKPLTMEEWAKIDPFTGKPRQVSEHDIGFNFAPTDGKAEEVRQSQIEHDRISRIDRD